MPQDNPEVRNELRRLLRELTELKKKIYGNLKPWETVSVARHPEPAADLRLPGVGLRRVRRAARRQVLRRRPGHPRRLGQAGRLPGDGRRPPEGQEHQGSHRLQLRPGPSGGLPQGDGQDAPGGQVPLAGDLPHRHARGLSRHRRRGARPVPGDRRLDVRDVAPAHADHLRGDRRRGIGRGHRARRGRPRGRAGARLLLGHQPRGLRRDPLEEPHLQGAGGRGVEDDLQGPSSAWA